MTFPLFSRPGSLAFLDDDADYLEMLALLLPRKWHARLFMQPRECIVQLHREQPFWEADAWHQQQLVDQWRAGRPLVPQILEYWATGRAPACCSPARPTTRSPSMPSTAA